MAEFKLQRSLARRLLKERPNMAVGMKLVQAELEASNPAWKSCRGIDWERGLTRWAAWLDALVKKAPPPPLGMVWFETPSELNAAMTSVSGWTKPGPAIGGFGANEPRVWPLKEDGYTHDAGLQMQLELEDAWKRAGWRVSDEKAAYRLRPGVFAIASSYTILLAVNGLQRTKLAQRWLKENQGTLGVLWGWAEGDTDAIGGLSDQGWTAFPKTAITKFSGPPGELEIISSPKKYLARGGDPRWRDKRTGKTILLKMAEYSPDFVDVEMAVEAGADVTAADKKGRTLLHDLGACGARTLKYLLSKGADARAIDAEGISVMDEVLFDGRCTVDQLELVYAAGGRPKARNPMLKRAQTAVSSRELLRNRAILRFWLKRAERINAAVAKGLVPLWIAIEQDVGQVVQARKGTYDLERNSYGMLLTVKMLLEEGADPNARHKEGKSPLIPPGATPLMVRSYYDTGFVRALLDHGADPHARCAAGKTALDYAVLAAKTPDKLGHAAAPKVVALLERAMKKAPSRQKR